MSGLDSEATHWTAAFEAARPRLWGLAYRLLGSAADAEDAVQSTWLKWRSADAAAVRRPEAWLVTACTRHCLDLRRAADRKRVDYVGLWLPEPVLGAPALTGPMANPEAEAELASSLTLAFLHLLERLSPAERAAYLLREIFEYDYATLASVLDKSEPACRQLVTRAKRALASEGSQPTANARTQKAALLDSFLAALRNGDASRLEGLLAADVELWGDGGGKAPDASKVIRGRRAVARFLLGVQRRYWQDKELEAAPFDASVDLLLCEASRIVGTFALTADEQGRCRRILIQRNPDKLRYVQDVATAAAAPARGRA